jgi:hypothetical protein
LEAAVSGFLYARRMIGGRQIEALTGRVVMERFVHPDVDPRRKTTTEAPPLRP